MSRLAQTSSLCLLLLASARTDATAEDQLTRDGDLGRRDGDAAEAAPAAPKGTRIASKIGVYEDDDGVTVVTPIFSFRQELFDTSSISVEWDVDILTAASVDVRTAATPRFEEVRHGVAIAGTHRVRDWETELAGSISVSREADYSSITAGAGFTKDLLEKNLTVGAGYAWVGNAVGRAKTPYDNFLETLSIHALSGSLTQLVSKYSYVSLSASLIGAWGYQGSVYRYVPLFLEGQVDPGAVDEVALETGVVRPLLRPAESVPRERLRGAIAARYNQAFSFGLTLVPSYRLYGDSWGVSSHTLDVAAYQHLPLGLILRLRNRFYLQSGADFFQRVYVIESPEALPELYTTDRELSAFWYDLVGAKLSLELPMRGLLRKVTFDVKADLQYTTYSDFAYLRERTALILGGGVVVEL